MAKGRNARGSLKLHPRKNGPSVWEFRTRVYEHGKPRAIKQLIGTVDELPTEKDARLAVAYMERHGPTTISALIRERHKPNKGCPAFTAAWYEERFREQGGKCAICGRVPKRLVVDHDHDDGALRGLLCSQCNSGIGLLRDSAAVLRAAVAYLEQYGQ